MPAIPKTLISVTMAFYHHLDFSDRVLKETEMNKTALTSNVVALFVCGRDPYFMLLKVFSVKTVIITMIYGFRR